MKCIEASYADDSAMSHALLMSLTDAQGEALFDSQVAVRFWTPLFR